MATVIAVGIGVAAAAFFVSILSVELLNLKYTNGVRRGELGWSHSENTVVEQELSVP